MPVPLLCEVKSIYFVFNLYAYLKLALYFSSESEFMVDTMMIKNIIRDIYENTPKNVCVQSFLQ